MATTRRLRPIRVARYNTWDDRRTEERVAARLGYRDFRTYERGGLMAFRPNDRPGDGGRRSCVPNFLRDGTAALRVLDHLGPGWQVRRADPRGVEALTWQCFRILEDGTEGTLYTAASAPAAICAALLDEGDRIEDLDAYVEALTQLAEAESSYRQAVRA